MAWVLIAVCAAVFVSQWFRWAIDRKSVRLPWSRVPIQEAAQTVYEVAEKEKALDFFISGKTGDPSYKLETFKYVFLVDDEVILHGIKPPSTVSLPIQRELYKQLVPAQGSSELCYSTPAGDLAYKDVTISKKDLRRIARDWPIQARREAQRFTLG